MPGAPWLCGASSFFGLSATTHSVVSNIPAIEAAFSKATLATLVGSIIPAFSIFSYSSVRALKPKSAFPSFTLFTTTEPSTPAFATI